MSCLMKRMRVLLIMTPLLAMTGCLTAVPQDEWDDFVMKGCSQLTDQAAYNRCYHDGTRSRSFCYEADGARICRERPYLACDRARLGEVPLDPTGLSLDSLGCERKHPSPPDDGTAKDTGERHASSGS